MCAPTYQPVLSRLSSGCPQRTAFPIIRSRLSSGRRLWSAWPKVSPKVTRDQDPVDRHDRLGSTHQDGDASWQDSPTGSLPTAWAHVGGLR